MVAAESQPGRALTPGKVISHQASVVLSASFCWQQARLVPGVTVEHDAPTSGPTSGPGAGAGAGAALHAENAGSCLYGFYRGRMVLLAAASSFLCFS